MTEIEISVFVLLAKGVFVLISALCIAATLRNVMAEKGWRSLRPVLIWLGWCLLTWLGAFFLLMLVNAHTHVPGKILVIRMMVLVYLLLGTALAVHLLKRLRNRDSPGAG